MMMAHFMPCNKSVTCEKIVKLFFDHVSCYHELPKDMFLITDFNLYPSFGSGILSY
jgi:hypothetical protein